MVTCKRCGAPIDPNGSFCSKCGTAQAVNPGIAPSPAPLYGAGPASAPTSAVSQKKGHPVLKVFGIIGAVIVGFGIWGSFLRSSHSGASAGSGSGIYANPYEESQQMCAVIKQRLNDYLHVTANPIECKSGMGDDGKLSLIIAFPYPIFADTAKIRNNALITAFSMAGESMSGHANVAIGRVYVMDSSATCFVVPGPFARGLYTKLMEKSSESELAQEVTRTATRVKIPEIHH